MKRTQKDRRGGGGIKEGGEKDEGPVRQPKYYFGRCEPTAKKIGGWY